MYRITEDVLVKGLERRQLARASRAAELLACQTETIESALRNRGLPLIAGEPRIATVERLVEAEYPDIAADLHNPPVRPPSGPVRADNGSGVPVPTITAEPPENPDDFAYMTGGKVTKKADPFLPTAHELGGFDGTALGDRAFVGFMDNQTKAIVKLTVKEIAQVSGFDVSSERRPTAIVDLPGWWLDLDYIKEQVGLIYAAALTGEPEYVIDMLNRLCREQGWGGPGEFMPDPDRLEKVLDEINQHLAENTDSAPVDRSLFRADPPTDPPTEQLDYQDVSNALNEPTSPVMFVEQKRPRDIF